MSRKLSRGTPHRTDEYVQPQDARGRWLLGGLGAGLAILVVLVGGYFVGAPGTLNPGPVMAAHAPFEGECIQCHAVGGAVEEVRCQRCHDAEMTDRLSHSAHVLLGSGDRSEAAAAEELDCMTCHIEHRGRQVSLAGIDDRECAACHEFGSLDEHPEFAAAKAGVQTGLGMLYNHRIHFEHEDSRIEDCQSCHEPTSDLSTFQPISFELHCAGPCHTHQADDGTVAQPYRVAATAILVPRPDELPPPYGGGSLEVSDFLNLVEIAGVTHREPWLVEAADALSRVIDPDGYRASRVAVQRQIDWLRERLQAPAVGDVPGEALQDWLERLGRELERLEARRAAETAEPDAEALERGRRLVEQTGERIAAADPGFADSWESREPVATAAAEAGDGGDDEVAYGDRRRELVALADAVAARAAGVDDELRGEAAALADRVEDLAAPADREPLDGPGREALRARLDQLDEALRVATRTEDPAARERAAEIRALQDLARARLAGGMPRTTFERRRADLLPLLEIMRASPDPGVAFAAEGIRRDLLRLRPVSPLLREARLESTRDLIDRIELELELRGEGITARRLGLGSFRDRAAIRREVDRLEKRGSSGRLPLEGGAADVDPATLGEGLRSLLEPCLKCHTMTGAELTPVRVTESVYRRAVFDHAPHVTVASCQDCHGRAPDGDGPATGVWASTTSRDLNSPGVANCQSCHTPSWAGDDCELCHVYHPPTVDRLLNR